MRAYLRGECVAGVRGPKLELDLPVLITSTRAYPWWVFLDHKRRVFEYLRCAGVQSPEVKVHLLVTSMYLWRVVLDRKRGWSRYLRQGLVVKVSRS